MKKKINILALAVMAFAGVSCSFLDVEAPVLTKEKFYKSEAEMLYSLAGVYGVINNEGFYGNYYSLMLSNTDDLSYYNRSSGSNYAVWYLHNAGSPEVYGAWTAIYKGINNANVFMEAAEGSEFDPDGKFYNEARFLRAYYHFELMKRYGGIPIMEDALSIDDPYAEIRREPLQDVVDFIVSECTELSDPETGLPDVYDIPTDNLGRATRGAALALKSRVLLYAASDLYNDDSWTGGYGNPELVKMSQETTRAQKWEAAAKAALEVINSPAGYSLGAYGDIGKVYNGNPEIIFVISEAESNSYERVNFPIGYEGGSSGNNPTQNLMEAYPNADGSDFKWDNILYGSGDTSPYENRDPRLALSLVTNNSYLYNRNVEIWEGGRDASPVAYATTTGYYLRKMLNTELDLYNNRMSVHAWPVFRLGEIYLNYAEALNEYDPGNADIAVYLDRLRTRSDVSMPGMAASLAAGGKTADQETVREYIRNERRIELAFEDHRAWDVRRWMEGPDAFGSPIYGVKVTKTVEGKFQYEKVQVETRTFSPSMYFYPIPQNEINIMGWPQNPLW